MSAPNLSMRAANALAMFLLQAGIGVFFLAPSVSFGDSGELIASAATLSIPHAPGYPLFCLLARGWAELVPWGDWAYRVNLLSPLCGAGACALLLDALLLRGAPAGAAWAGVLFLGLSPSWLRTCLQTEVFAPHCLLAAAALWGACRFGESSFDPRPMAFLGLCLGLGGADHHTLVLAVPGLLGGAWALSRPSPSKAWKGLAALTAFALLGLCLYLYLPLRSRVFPPLDWGHPVDPPRFLHVLLRRDYGSFSLTVEGAQAGRWGAIPVQSLRYLRGLWGDFGPAGVSLAVLGALLWRRSPISMPALLPALLLLVAGPGFLCLGNPPADAQTEAALERFLLLPAMGAALFAAAGAACSTRVWRHSPWALALVPVLSAALSIPSWSQRWDLAAQDYGLNLLRSLPRGSVLFMDGGDDSFYTLAYAQFALGLRRDVELHDRGGLVFPNPYGADFRRLDQDSKEKRRLEVEEAAARARPLFYSTLRESMAPGRPLLLWGLLRSSDPLAAPGRGASPEEAPRGRALWEVYPIRFSPDAARAHYRYRALMPVYPVMRAAAQALRGETEPSLARLRSALAIGPDVLWLPGAAGQVAQWAAYLRARRGDWGGALRAYEEAGTYLPDSADITLNIAVTLEKQKRFQEAEAAYRRAAEQAPDSLAVWHNLGSLYWTLEIWESAADAFDKAARLAPADPKLAAFRDEARHRHAKR